MSSEWLHVFILCSIALIIIDMALLVAVVYVIGKQYSFFAPWRVLLLGLIAYCGFLLVSDAYWFIMEIDLPPATTFYAIRMALGRLFISGILWRFSWLWWQGLRGGRARG